MENNFIFDDGAIIATLPSRPLFQPGKLQFTGGAVGALHARYDTDDDIREAFLGFFIRHLGGDWNEMGKHDAKVNASAVAHGARVLSVFAMKPLPSEEERGIPGEKIWLLTEADRTLTTVLLPEEY